MPDTTVTQYVVVNTPGDFLTYFRALSKWISVMGFELTEVYGWKAARVTTFEDESTVYYQYVIFAGNPEERKDPVRYWTDASGASRSWTADSFGANTAEFLTNVTDTYSEVADVFVAILTEWTDAVTIASDVSYIQSIADFVIAATLTVQIDTEVERMIMVDQLTACFPTHIIFDPPNNTDLLRAGARAAPFSALSGPVDGAQLQRIVDALEDISMKGEEISINHQGAMFSVNGKVIVET